MIFVREASVAVVLVTLTLSLQCAGMAALVGWANLLYPRAGANDKMPLDYIIPRAEIIPKLKQDEPLHRVVGTQGVKPAEEEKQ